MLPIRRSSAGGEAGHLKAEFMPELGYGFEPTWVETSSGGRASSSRASGSTARPSEHAHRGVESKTPKDNSRKSVTWAGPDDEGRNLLRSSRSEGVLVRPRKLEPSVSPPLQTEHELQTQLNLLRERSWTEQQSLRKQLEDSKFAQDRLKKELEHATVQTQQLQNEAQDLRDRVSAAGGLAQDASASQLFEEKNAQIRHLEALVKELASSQTISVGTVRPMSSSKNRQGEDRSTKELQAELEALRVERAKEQEDLKELEQVVPMFEEKMAAIKKENKDLKRTNGELRQRIAMSEEAGHQMVPLASSQERKLQSINENLSRRILESTIRQTDFRSLLDFFGQWKASGSKVAQKRVKHFGDGEDEVDALSDQNVCLQFQLEKSGKETEVLREEMDSMKTMYVNMLESERTQSAMLAQRMMKLEDDEKSLNSEVVELRKANKSLTEQLDACKRRLEYLDGERRGADSGSAEDKIQNLQATVLGLQDDVASLAALRTSTAQRLSLIREVGILRTVEHKRHISLSRVFASWRACPTEGKGNNLTVERLRSTKNKLLVMQAWQGWAVAASFVSKAEVAAKSQQLEAVTSTVKALQDGKMAQHRELQEQTRKCQELTTTLCLREQDLETLSAQLAALQKERSDLRSTMAVAEGRVAGLLRQMPLARATTEELEEELRAAEAERSGLQEKLDRLLAERESWLKEQSRIRHRQASAAGAAPASEVQLALLQERCQVLAHKLDAAHVERAKTAAAAASIAKLRDALHGSVLALASKAAALCVRHPLPAQPALQLQDPETCASQATVLGRELEVLSTAIVAAAADLQGKLDRVVSSDAAVLSSQPSRASEVREEELKELREKLGRMGDEVREKVEEVARQRAELDHQLQSTQQQVSSLAASLNLAQAENRYLQDIADGGSSKQAFAQSLVGLDSVLQTLNAKLGSKAAECHKLERHLNKCLMEGQQALEQAHRDNASLRQQLMAAGHNAADLPSDPPPAHQGTGDAPGLAAGNEKLETAMQANAALSDEVKEMSNLWRLSAAEAFEANCKLAKVEGQLREQEGLGKQRQAAAKKAEEEIRQLEETKLKLEREDKSLREELARAEQRARAADGKAGEREAERDALESSMRGMVERMRGLEQEQAASEHQRAALQGEVDALTARCHALLEDAGTKRAEAEEVRQRQRTCMTSLAVDVKAVETELATLRADHEVEGMREELRRLQMEERCSQLTKSLQAAEQAASEAAQGGSGLEERVRSMQAQNAELSEQVGEAEERERAIQTEREALAQQLEALEEERGRLAQEAGKARREAEGVRQELEEERGDWEQEKAALEEDAAKKKSRLEESQRAVSRLEQDVRQGEEEVGRLKAALEEARTGDREQQEREQRLRRELKELQEQSEEGERQRTREAARAAAEMEGLRARLEEAVKEREKRERAEGAARKEAEALEEKRRELDAALARAEGESSHLQGTVRALSRERDELAERVRELGEAASEGRRQVRELERALGESEGRQKEAERVVETTSTGAEAKMERLRQELEEEKKETARAQTEKQYLKERVQALKAAGEAGRREVEERELAMAQLSLQRTALQLSLADAQAAVEGRDLTVQVLEDAVLKREALLSGVREELRGAQAEVAEQQLLLEERQRSASGLEERVEELHGRLQAAEGEVKRSGEEAEAREARAAEEKEAMTEAARALSAEIEEGKGRVEEVERELRREVERKEALEEELGALQGQLASLSQEVALRSEEAARGEAACEAASAKTEQLRAYLEEERAEREKQEAVMEEMRAVLEQAEEELKKREDTAASLRERAGGLEGELQAALASASALEAGMQETQEELRRCKEALAATEVSVDEATEENVALKTRLEEVERAMEAVWQECEELKAKLAAAEEQALALQVEVEHRSKEVEELKASNEQEAARLEEQLGRAGAEAQEWKGKASKAKAHGEELARRLQEAEEEGARTASRLAEYDEILQGKGRELAKLRGKLAEEQALVAEANERLSIMRGNEEKQRAEMAGRERQLKRMQAELDALHDGDAEGQGGASFEGGEAARLRAELAVEREERRQAVEERDGKVKELEALLLHSHLKIVEHKLGDGAAADSKASLPPHAMAARQDLDDARSKGSTDRAVTPGRGGSSESSSPTTGAAQAEEMGVNPRDNARDESEGQGEAERLRAELEKATAALKDAQKRCSVLVKTACRPERDDEDERVDSSHCLEPGEARELAGGALRRMVMERANSRQKEEAFRKLEENWVRAGSRRQGLLHLLVRCQTSVRRRAEEKSKEEERAAETERAREKERQQVAEETLALQRELVEKTDALLASEKKFAHLLNWVQKGKQKSSP